jgi:hypothetical protein
MLGVDVMSGLMSMRSQPEVSACALSRILVDIRSIEDAILAAPRVRHEVDYGAPDVFQHAFLVGVLHPGAVIEAWPKVGS